MPGTMTSMSATAGAQGLTWRLSLDPPLPSLNLQHSLCLAPVGSPFRPHMLSPKSPGPCCCFSTLHVSSSHRPPPECALGWTVYKGRFAVAVLPEDSAPRGRCSGRAVLLEGGAPGGQCSWRVVLPEVSGHACSPSPGHPAELH